MQHIKGLDTLRAFAVIFVIIAHWGLLYTYWTPTESFLRQTFMPDPATGVYMFFTLSGFLITTLLVNARFAEVRPNKFSILKNFIARRTLRIFPIYYIFTFVLYQIFSEPGMKSELPWYLTYTTNFMLYRANAWGAQASHLWTLAIEEQFYLVWPWLVLFVSEKYLKYLFAACIVIGAVTTSHLFPVKIEPFMVYNCADSFAIGGLYAYLRRRTDVKRFEKAMRWIGPFLLVYYFVGKYVYFMYNYEPLSFLKKTVDSTITLWLIVLIVNNRSERVRKYLLENRALNFIGRISYCMYLIHPYVFMLIGPKMYALRNSFPSNPGLAALISRDASQRIVQTIVLFLLCWLSYVAIEKPIMSLKRFFTYR